MDVFTRGNISVYSMLEKHNDGVQSIIQISGSTPRAMQTGKRLTCFEAIFFILSIMMSLYSKQNCNNNRDDE